MCLLEKCCFGQSELYGKILNISLFGVPPYLNYDPASGTLSGIDIDILRILATTLQFMPNILVYTNYGQLKNGTFTNGTIKSVRIPFLHSFVIAHLSFFRSKMEYLILQLEVFHMIMIWLK